MTHWYIIGENNSISHPCGLIWGRDDCVCMDVVCMRVCQRLLVHVCLCVCLQNRGRARVSFSEVEMLEQLFHFEEKYISHNMLPHFLPLLPS